ncbi:MAG: hypothetical protein ACOC59_01485, partial [Bacteroidota bacterium]
HRSLLVRMKLRNGFWEHFIVYTDGERFTYKGGEYLTDPKAMYPELSTGLLFSFYHEDCSLPIQFDMDIPELIEPIKQTQKLPESQQRNIKEAINPRTLKQLVRAEFVQQLAKGDDLLGKMKQLMTIGIINIIAAVLILMVIMRASGWI